jgi:hypothetical protein
MTETTEELSVSRRNFLRNLAISALAATTAGTTAAMLTQNLKKTTVSSPVISQIPTVPTAELAAPAVPAVPAVQSAETVVRAHNDAGELLARLAESQAENMRLQAALEAAQHELDSLLVTNNSNRSATEELSLQLAGANEQIGVLGGLVALYEQLDDVDISDTVQTGMATVSESISELLNQTPALSEGIERGQQALTEVEDHLPTLEDGRLWLDAQADKLGAFYESIELVLQNVLESVGSFIDMVDSWFEGIRKWLPFGLETKASNVVEALSALVAETPQTISGLDTYVAQPLDMWLKREDDAPRLQRTLIKPIREQVLAEANETINRAHSIQTAYQEQLALPVELSIANRNTIRHQIVDYRQQHQV